MFQRRLVLFWLLLLPGNPVGSNKELNDEVKCALLVRDHWLDFYICLFVASGVCYLVSIFSCQLSSGCGLVPVVCCLVSVGCCLLSFVRCVLSGVWCLVSVVCCLLSVVLCLVSDVWCLLSGVGCLVPVVCCLLSTVWVCCLVSVV